MRAVCSSDFLHHVLHAFVWVNLAQNISHRSFMSAWRNSPSMSDFAVSLPSITSIMYDSMKALMDTVGELASSLPQQSHCLRPSAHPRPLMRPRCLFFKNIQRLRASFFCWLVTAVGLSGMSAPFLWIWRSSFMPDSAPASSCNSGPFFAPHCDDKLS